jgi:hypothetical protein
VTRLIATELRGAALLVVALLAFAAFVWAVG